MIKYLCTLLFLTSCLGATELAPWFSPVYEFEYQTKYIYSWYHRVNAGAITEPYTSYDQFINLSLDFTCSDNVNAEFEMQTAQTRARKFGLEYFKLTGRYLLLNDVGGADPVSLAAGISVWAPFEQSLHDVSVFHHSLFDTEVHLSVGKEWACGPEWVSRVWGLAGFGLGIKGSPWLHGIAAYERNFCNVHHLKFSVDYLQGLGGLPITILSPFPGYFDIRHQSLDAKICYSYIIYAFGSFNFEYIERLYSKNCPQNLRAVTASFLWPFSL